MKLKTHNVLPQMMKKGMFVIVEEWYPDETAASHLRKRPIGLPVKILSLALPIIAVEFCAIPGLRGTMDTRQAKFTRVPMQYVRSLVPGYGKIKPREIVEVDI